MILEVCWELFRREMREIWKRMRAWVRGSVREGETGKRGCLKGPRRPQWITLDWVHFGWACRPVQIILVPCVFNRISKFYCWFCNLEFILFVHLPNVFVLILESVTMVKLIYRTIMSHANFCHTDSKDIIKLSFEKEIIKFNVEWLSIILPV